MSKTEQHSLTIFGIVDGIQVRMRGHHVRLRFSGNNCRSSSGYFCPALSLNLPRWTKGNQLSELDGQLSFLGLWRWRSIAVRSVGTLRLEDFVSGLKLMVFTPSVGGYMKRILGICTVLMALIALTVPVFAQDSDDNHRQGDRDDARRQDNRRYEHGGQQSRLSSEDQHRFDSYYSRWQGYRRTNNRNEMESMEKRMRDVMSHNNIPSNVPFDEIASDGGRGYGDQYGQRRQDRLSSEDQQRFDSYYSRWQGYRRTNNRDEIESMEKRMRDVMSRNNIPPDVPFDEVASGR